MNKFFRKLPLQAKLMLIGLIPFLFLVYLTIQFYDQQAEKLKLFDNYKTYLAESAAINKLIDAMQEERKFSFDYAMTRSMRQELVLQRPRTDALIQQLERSNDPSITGFTNYTKLKDLSAIRNRIDSFTAAPNDVMHFYSNTVFRLNTLNTIPPANTAYLQPVYKDLMAQKILSEMITYLGIIRSNIYNVLHTRKYMVETLIGTMGTHDVFNSYETELLAKASPTVLDEYKQVRNFSALKPTITHIDSLFKRFAFDSSYTAASWWKVSDEGSNALRNFQNNIWNRIDSNINGLYNEQERTQRRSLVLLIFALVSVVAVVGYIVFIISSMLAALRRAAEKISNGEVGPPIKIESNDVIGQLALSIARIDQNNQAIAKTAAAVGQGNFNITLQPRSEDDVLANAIIQMKKDLKQYSEKMEELVAHRTEELERSNDDLQQFAHVASHDLKEPLRKIATYSNILCNDYQQGLSDKSKRYLQKIEDASLRMSAMIEGVLAYSTVAVSEKDFEVVDLEKILEGVQNDLELAIIQKEAQIIIGKLPRVKGIPLLVQQLFYNLLNNALKFSKPGITPVITITASAGQSNRPRPTTTKQATTPFVQVTIEDNGIGFDPYYMEKMFEVFSRLHTKEAYEGTGLGLALCRKIVQRHGGDIYAEGEEGKGSKFHILLPAS